MTGISHGFTTPEQLEAYLDWQTSIGAMSIHEAEAMLPGWRPLGLEASVGVLAFELPRVEEDSDDAAAGS